MIILETNFPFPLTNGFKLPTVQFRLTLHANQVVISVHFACDSMVIFQYLSYLYLATTISPSGILSANSVGDSLSLQRSKTETDHVLERSYSMPLAYIEEIKKSSQFFCFLPSFFFRDASTSSVFFHKNRIGTYLYFFVNKLINWRNLFFFLFQVVFKLFSI